MREALISDGGYHSRGSRSTINMSSKERHFGTPAISEACGKREPALECSGVETIRRKCL